MTKLRGHIKNLVLFCFSFNLINVGKEIPIRRPVVIYTIIGADDEKRMRKELRNFHHKGPQRKQAI